MANKTIIAASILAADFKKLEEEILLSQKAGCEWLHFDVMDGNFVDNISFGIPILKSIKEVGHQVRDVHLMIANPKKYVQPFIDAGADLITFHYEAVTSEEAQELIDIIHKNKKMVGISIKPNTNIDLLIPFIYQIDLILIMSVEPGFGGQLFDESVLSKIDWLTKYCEENGFKPYIQVDGGINLFTSKMCVANGANVLVAGSYLFGHDDIKDRVEELKSHKRG